MMGKGWRKRPGLKWGEAKRAWDSSGSCRDVGEEIDPKSKIWASIQEGENEDV